MSDLRVDCRFATQADLPGIQKLWLKETEWGALPIELTRHWDGAPAGQPRTLIAVNRSDGYIVGQFGFVPAMIKVGEAEVPGLRPHSTIVSRAFRASVKTLEPSDQPTVMMYDNGIERLREEGFRIAYMIPHPRWAAFFRLRPGVQVAGFPLRSIGIEAVPHMERPEGFVVKCLNEMNGSVDELWRQSSSQYACGLVRTAATLKWKLELGRYLALGVYRRRDLVGVVTARTRGDGMWLICDMITADADEALEATTVAAAKAATTETATAQLSEGHPMRKVSILATRLMTPTLERLGFALDDWTFPLIVDRLDDSIAAGDVDPAKWYLAAND